MNVEDCCQNLLAKILPIADPNREGVCIDVGVGNFAFYCELFARLGFSSIAVEPLPVPKLREICQHYSITLVEACLSEIDGTQTLYLGTYQGNQNINFCSLVSDWWGASAATIQVKSVTLEKLFSTFQPQPVTCLKVDVEGGESLIIRQLKNLAIAQLPKVVMFEYGGGANRSSGQGGWASKFINATLECLNILKECGYSLTIVVEAQLAKPEKILDLQAIAITPENIFEPDAVWGNIIAFREFTPDFPETLAQICNSGVVESAPTLGTETSPASAVKPQPNKPQPNKVQINLAKTGEEKVIQNLIKPGQIIFDVGANQGEWSQYVLKNCQPKEIHLFEPVLPIYYQLLSQIEIPLNGAKIIPNPLALGQRETCKTFYFYTDFPAWSTFYRRHDIEKQYHLKPPQELPVFTTTLDAYCSRLGLQRIDFLKIDVEGGELDVLFGAEELLRRGKIDYLQFEYGGTYLDANVTLKQVFDYLRKFRYEIFKISPEGLAYQPQFRPELENYQYSNFLAINERFRTRILRQPATMLNLPSLFTQHGIKPKGVIHIGAYEGQEITAYQQMGIEKVLFVEANPAVFERLKANIAGVENVQAVNCAISDRNGSVTLHITSMEQSSSILPLKKHREIYQDIQETAQITVPAKTLDNLLQELQLNPADFNILNIDIQGAELLAFQGATHLLQYIEAINTEVSYQEIYEGCALIHQIDEFLENHGFERVATTTPYHPSWGDAFYRRQPVITMSSLGKNGRFANQIFQYAFLKIYAKQHHLRVETPPWIGQFLFGHQDPAISRQLPQVREESNDRHQSKIIHSQVVYQNVDFWGYFQYNTAYYAPYKDYFRSLFNPVEPIKNYLQQAVNHLRSQGQTLVGIHLRRGDYGYEHFYVAPNQWYKDWLSGFWETLERPVLFIASDEPETVLDDFREYHPITSKDLGLKLPQAEFYPDFYLLSQCDAVAISNSSFSFLACMLNQQGKFFFRPHLATQKLIAFDPWQSETILLDAKVFNPTPAFLSWVASRAEQYRINPSDPNALADLLRVRQQLADFWLNVSSDQLPHAYVSGYGKLQQILLNSGIQDIF